MNVLETKLLSEFLKKEPKLKNLDLIVCIADDEWAEDKGFLIMEREDNGHVWQCWATNRNTIEDIVQVG